MGKAKSQGSGTRQSPWVLKTPPGTSDFEAYRDEAADPAALIVQVGKTEVRYQLRGLDDLHKMLKQHGDWMALGSADEQKPAAEGTVEAWARSPKNPVGRLVWTEKGLARPLRDVRAAGHGSDGARRGRAPTEEQPNASSLSMPGGCPA